MIPGTCKKGARARIGYLILNVVWSVGDCWTADYDKRMQMILVQVWSFFVGNLFFMENS